ncbi:substrate-binding periplasmic protein [Piscirickettsia litoralis]|nr:transporter substrate-binding domain-containing protein [Piscirickettsia litoralis]
MSSFSTYARSLEGQTIRVCDDGAEWPPYTYFLRENGVKTDKVVGFSVDVVNSILEGEYKAKVIYKLPPWKRCLRELAQGRYDLAMNSSYNKERAKTYTLTLPYYKVTPSYIFFKGDYPNNDDGPDIKKSSDFSKYIVCGLRGYNYEDFNMDVSIINSNASTFKQAFAKLRYKRCNLILARIEILRGFKFLDQDYLTGAFGYRQNPGSEASQFTMLISKESPYHDQLKSALDQGIQKLKDTGKLKKMLNRYLYD